MQMKETKRLGNMKQTALLGMVLALGGALARADEVTDWNNIFLKATFVPPLSPPPILVRSTGIFQAAVFDAVNGIDRLYTPIHVQPAAPQGASQRAAALQAAYAILVLLFPSQTATFDAQRATSLAAIASGAGAENSDSIASGVDWGQTVADAIWAWRSVDGFANSVPPFLGGTAPGQWRPTPPALAPGLVPQLAKVTPFFINSPSQFRPAGPPALTSAQYTGDFNETKSMGSSSSSTRTPDQTLFAQFWASGAPADFWDPVATSLAAERHFTLSETSHLLALVNLAMADAIIGCWDAKYAYVFWRPITAIQLADGDGNADTSADPSWTPLLATPPFPEYTSAHSCVSGAAAHVLSAYFGDNTPITVASDGMPGVTRSFPSFSAALEEVKSARVFGGIHFRTACNDGQALGIAVADFITANALQPTLTIKSATAGQIEPFAEQSIVAAYGANLAAGPATATTPLSTSLDGTSVTVTDSAGISRPALLFYVSPGQVNYEIPEGSAPGPATVTIKSQSGTTQSVSIQIGNISPGLFQLNSSGLVAAWILPVISGVHQNLQPVYEFDASNNLISHPIDLGTDEEQIYLELYGTGIRNAKDVAVTVGGLSVPVLFAGAAPGFVGVDQVNIGPLPRSLAGAGSLNILLTADGQTANTVNLTIR
jgi:uncharacterized protein (TIGR03437 family)